MRPFLTSLVLAGLSMTTSASSPPAEIHSVQIRDRQGGVIAVLDRQGDLQQFHRHWPQKTQSGHTTEELPYSAFEYTLNIRSAEHTGLWWYNRNGLAARLDKRVQPVFRIADPQAFNTLLGLPTEQAAP